MPEGLVEFIGEVNILIKEINEILAKEGDKPTALVDLVEYVAKDLTDVSQKLLRFLPLEISEQLLLDRDPHGNVQVAKIETEKLLIMLLRLSLKRGRPRTSTRENSALKPITLVMRDVVHSHQPSIVTIATVSVLMLLP